MRKILFLTLLAGAALAADSDYNGRWDITPMTGAPRRGWWVELNGVGTPQASGTFVSAYNGDRNPIDTIAVENGELMFSINPPKNNTHPGPSVYRARLQDGKLVGNFAVPGQTGMTISWTAVRAPVIKDRDDGTWKEEKPIELFNGHDTTGWRALNPATEFKWSVVDGTMRNAPPTTDLVSQQNFWNFKLHVDFRIKEHSNSGIGLRGRYEIQILDDFGKRPDTHSAGALYSRIAPAVNASRPAGEWQSYDIRLVGRTLTVVHNGTKVLDKVEVDGLTAIASNANEADPGPFIIQGDHSYVEIKSFVVTPLVH